MQYSLGNVVLHSSLTPMIGILNYIEQDNRGFFNFKIRNIEGITTSIFTPETLVQFKKALGIIKDNVPGDFINFSLKVENVHVKVNKLSRLSISNISTKKVIYQFKVSDRNEIIDSLLLITSQISIVISQINLVTEFIKQGGNVKDFEHKFHPLEFGNTRLIAPKIFTSLLNVPYYSSDKKEELISIGMGRNKIILEKGNNADRNFINFLISSLEDLKANRNQKVYYDTEKPEHCRYISFTRREITNSADEVTPAWGIVINTDTLIPGASPSKLTFFIGKDSVDYFVDSFVAALKEEN